MERAHDQTAERADEDVKGRLERKRVSQRSRNVDYGSQTTRIFERVPTQNRHGTVRSGYRRHRYTRRPSKFRRIRSSDFCASSCAATYVEQVQSRATCCTAILVTFAPYSLVRRMLSVKSPTTHASAGSSRLYSFRSRVLILSIRLSRLASAVCALLIPASARITSAASSTARLESAANDPIRFPKPDVIEASRSRAKRATFPA